jgi:hypothetical protein
MIAQGPGGVDEGRVGLMEGEGPLEDDDDGGHGWADDDVDAPLDAAGAGALGDEVVQ